MKLVIWGAGGHGRVILDIARAMGTFDRIAFFDDSSGHSELVADAEVLSGSIGQAREAGFDCFVIAIGANVVRARKFWEASEAGLKPATCIHPTAWISPRAEIGAGSVVMPRVVVQTDALVGRNCILNTGVIVEHDCRVGDHVHLSPGVTLCGTVQVGAYAHLGAGVTAIPGSIVGESAMVGAGAVVLNRIAPGVTAVGVPARVIKQPQVSDRE